MTKMIQTKSTLLTKNITRHRKNIHPLKPTLLNRAQLLTKGIDVDLNKALDDQDGNKIN